MAVRKAVMFTAHEHAELVEQPADERPLGEQEVRGRTLATLVSPGTELQGGYVGDRFPYQPGYSAVFEIEAVGSEVVGLQPGGLAYCMGNHRSEQRTRQQAVVPVPAGLAPEAAVFARLMGVSWTTLITTAARPPATVVVSGLGPVGNLAAQIFRVAGYDVAAVDPVPERRAMAEACGVSPVFAAAPHEDPAWQNRVAMVVECSGHENAVWDACKLVRKGGEVVMVGVPWQRRSDLLAYEILTLVFHRYVHLRSGWEWEIPREPREFAPGAIYDNVRAALEWLRDGKVKVTDLAPVVPPTECTMAYQNLLHRPAEQLSFVFDWR